MVQEVRVLRPLLLLAVVGCGTPGPPQGELVLPAKEERSFDQVHEQALWAAGRIGREIDCATNMVRYLCVATRVDGAGFVMPPEGKVLVGLTVVVRNSRTIEQGAMETAAATVLHLDPAGVMVKGLFAGNPAENQEVASLISNVSLILKGKTNEVRVSQGLEDFLRDKTDVFLQPVVDDAYGGTFDNGNMSRIYRVPRDPEGFAYVVVESGEKGVFLSVFPDVERVVGG